MKVLFNVAPFKATSKFDFFSFDGAKVQQEIARSQVLGTGKKLLLKLQKLFVEIKNPFGNSNGNYLANSAWIAALKSSANLVNLLSGGHLSIGR